MSKITLKYRQGKDTDILKYIASNIDSISKIIDIKCERVRDAKVKTPILTSLTEQIDDKAQIIEFFETIITGSYETPTEREIKSKPPTSSNRVIDIMNETDDDEDDFAEKAVEIANNYRKSQEDKVFPVKKNKIPIDRMSESQLDDLMLNDNIYNHFEDF